MIVYFDLLNLSKDANKNHRFDVRCAGSLGSSRLRCSERPWLRRSCSMRCPRGSTLPSSSSLVERFGKVEIGDPLLMTVCWGKSLFWMGKLTISTGPFSIATLNYERVDVPWKMGGYERDKNGVTMDFKMNDMENEQIITKQHWTIFYKCGEHGKVIECQWGKPRLMGRFLLRQSATWLGGVLWQPMVWQP